MHHFRVQKGQPGPESDGPGRPEWGGHQRATTQGQTEQEKLDDLRGKKIGKT